MDLITIIISIIVWGLVVRYTINNKPNDTDSKSLKNLLWMFFGIMTLSFLFSGGSSSQATPTRYGGGYCDNENCCDDECYDKEYDDDYDYFDNHNSDDDYYYEDSSWDDEWDDKWNN